MFYSFRLFCANKMRHHPLFQYKNEKSTGECKNVRCQYPYHRTVRHCMDCPEVFSLRLFPQQRNSKLSISSRCIVHTSPQGNMHLNFRKISVVMADHHAMHVDRSVRAHSRKICTAEHSFLT